jgi:hypothetical protein
LGKIENHPSVYLFCLTFPLFIETLGFFPLYFVSNPSQKSFQDVPHSPKRKTFGNAVGKNKEQKNYFS